MRQQGVWVSVTPMRSSSLGVLAGMILLVAASTARAEAPVAPPPLPTPPVAPPPVPTEAQPAAAAPDVAWPGLVAPVPAWAPLAPPGVPPPATTVAQGTQLRAPGDAAANVPLARRWWFWAGLGGAAVAVVVAAIAIAPREAYMGNAQPGVVTVF
jgi:hypothetical protein